MSPPSTPEDEERRLREVALETSRSILRARQRSEKELIATKEALVDEKRILEILHRTGARLASNLETETLVQMVTDAGTELSGAEFGAFFYTSTGPDGEQFELYTLSGAPREAFASFPRPRATDVFGPTFRGEGTVRSDDITQDPRYGRLGPHHGMPEGHLPVRSYLAVPVVARDGEVLGGLFFGHHRTGVFTERTERILSGIAAQAAIAIDNARLYEAARRAAHEKERLLEAEREARAEIERVSRMKDEFLATLSHELRTPLNAVLGWSEVLLRTAGEDSRVRGGLDAIVRNARVQAQLIEDLLDMNRIVSGKIRLDVRSVELAPVIESALESIGPSARAKSIRIDRKLDAVGPLHGDPNRLQQIVWNLLSNAVKFTPAGGRVEVALEGRDDGVEIVVKDTGIGISPEFLPQLFERFRQADSSAARQHGGLGLGLSIVRQLVELHGGSVVAESSGAGAGATFRVSLPRGVPSPGEQDESPGRRPEVTASGDVDLRSLRVLVVEDDADSRALVVRLLEEAGARVSPASSAAEAIERLVSFEPELVISDIGMPGRDGYQLIRDIRALPPEGGGAVPAIALTAFARPEDRTRALLAGYQVHLSKPIEPRELVVTAATLCGRHPRRHG